MSISPSRRERRSDWGRPSPPELVRLGQTQFWFILGAAMGTITLIVLALASA